MKNFTKQKMIYTKNRTSGTPKKSLKISFIPHWDVASEKKLLMGLYNNLTLEINDPRQLTIKGQP